MARSATSTIGEAPASVHHASSRHSARVLDPWMNFVLRFVAVYNVLAGLSMVIFYHEGYHLLKLDKPQLVLPLQLVGVMVGLFGVGYWLVAKSPVENRNVLMLGFFSKFFGTILGFYYMAVGTLPWERFLPMVFLGDIIYLVPFLVIMRRLYGEARRLKRAA